MQLPNNEYAYFVLLLSALVPCETSEFKNRILRWDQVLHMRALSLYNKT